MPLESDENLTGMDRMLFGEIPAPSNSKGKGKAVEDDGYDSDVFDGAHVLATMMSISHVADKKGKPDVDENATDDEETHQAAMALLTLSPHKRRCTTPIAGEDVPKKKLASSSGKKGTPAGKSGKEAAKEPKTQKSKPTRPFAKSGAVNEKTTSPSASRKSGTSNRATSAGKTLAATKSASPGKSVSPTDSTNGKFIGNAYLTARETIRKRQTPKAAPMDPRPIPTSWDEMDDADKTMMSMKAAGKTWAEIAEVYQENTGQVTQPSSLPNRLTRIKCNMTTLRRGDDALLMIAKEHIEKKFAHDKWTMIAARMKNCYQTDDYPTAFLQKEAKKCETLLEKDDARGKKLEAAIAKAKSGDLGTSDEDNDDSDDEDYED